MGMKIKCPKQALFMSIVTEISLRKLGAVV